MVWALFAVAVLLVSALIALQVQSGKMPELGVVEGHLKPLSGKPNGVSTRAQNPEQRIDAWPVLPDAFERLTQAAPSLGRAEVVTRTEDYLHLVFTTRTLRWRDDVEFWRDPASETLEIRSQSRVGHSDLGVNRARLEGLKQLYLTGSDGQ